MKSKQLSNGSVSHARVFAGFSSHGNSIYTKHVKPREFVLCF